MTHEVKRSLLNEMIVNGHRLSCGATNYRACNCDQPYRRRRRLIMTAVAASVLALIVAAIWWLAVYAPALGHEIGAWASMSVMLAVIGYVVGAALYGIGTLLQKAFWR